MGTKIPEAEAFRLLDRFLEAGGRLIDTAAVYTDWIPGETRRVEHLLGRWIRHRDCRESVYLATKGCHPSIPFTLAEAGMRVRPEIIRSDLEGSLRVLGVDQIDLWFLHRDDPLYPVEPLVDILNQFRREGKVCAFGASNWSAARIQKANTYAELSGQAGFLANQMLWNLGSDGMEPLPDRSLRRMDAAMLAMHQENGLLAMPYSSLAGGFFSKRLAGDAGVGMMRLAAYETDANISREEWLRGYVLQQGCSITAACLAFLWAHPFPVVPLVGPRTLLQLEECLQAAEMKFPDPQ